MTEYALMSSSQCLRSTTVHIHISNSLIYVVAICVRLIYCVYIQGFSVLLRTACSITGEL